MNKLLPILSFLLFSCAFLSAQGYDNETPESTITWTYFGSSLDGQNAPIIDNPNATGVNTSSKVVEYVKASGSEVWAGAYSNPMLPTPLDLTAGGQICLDAHFDHIGNIAFKLEKSTNGFSNWVTTVENTTVGEWETMCYDLSANGLEDAMTPAAGGIFEGFAIFIDFQMSDPDNDVTTYFDNIRYVPATPDCITIFDFEADGTTTEYQYFGSTLDGTKALNIANPNATGVNTSATVLEYTKPVGSEVWAGAFATPAPAPIDATSGGMLCVDVHMDHIGNIGLKLEAATNGSSNWIQTVENTVINEWEQVCIDLDLNGLEDAMTPATGDIYNQLVIFPDFGTSWTDNDVITYIDNLVIKPTSSGGSYDVTFRLDLSTYTEAFTQPYVSGTFNDFSADANPMSDDDLDGIWETTINLAGGGYEFKYQLDGWAVSDQFLVSDDCTNTTVDTDGTVFTNRSMVVAADIVLDAVCLNSCYACGQEVEITWNLNMTNETVAAEGVYVAGGEFFGHGELPAMTDDDGDGIYTITLRRAMGFETDYTFINGLCLPDWSCKENIEGQDCAVAPFNDRHLDPAMDNVTINTCFGECSTTTECTGGPVKFNATFNVDMNNTTIDPGGVFLAGGLINNWTPADTPMTDDDGDGVYTVTVELAPAIVEYKFVNGEAFEIVILDDCTMQDPSGQFINRFFIMEAKDTVLVAHQWESCEVAVGLNDVQYNEDLFALQPNLVTDFTNLVCDVQSAKTVEVFNLNGQLIQTYNMSASEYNVTIDMTGVSSGMYVVSVTTDAYRSTKRMVVR